MKATFFLAIVAVFAAAASADVHQKVGDVANKGGEQGLLNGLAEGGVISNNGVNADINQVAKNRD